MANWNMSCNCSNKQAPTRGAAEETDSEQFTLINRMCRASYKFRLVVGRLRWRIASSPPSCKTETSDVASELRLRRLIASSPPSCKTWDILCGSELGVASIRVLYRWTASSPPRCKAQTSDVVGELGVASSSRAAQEMDKKGMWNLHSSALMGWNFHIP